MATPLRIAGGRHPNLPGVVETVTLVVHDGCYIVVDSWQVHAENLDDALGWYDHCVEPFMTELDTDSIAD